VAVAVVLVESVIEAKAYVPRAVASTLLLLADKPSAKATELLPLAVLSLPPPMATETSNF
jgi:hypothetical protein